MIAHLANTSLTNSAVTSVHNRPSLYGDHVMEVKTFILYSWKISRVPISEDFQVFCFPRTLKIFCPKVMAKLTAKLCHVVLIHSTHK